MRREYDWLAAGQRIRLARLGLGITEKEAADAYGVSLPTFRRYEKGDRQRGCGFVDFAEKFDVPLIWLITGKGAWPSPYH